jgi:hypothetical protein
MPKLRRLAREPLVHMIVLGGFLFGLWRAVSPAAARRVSVSADVKAGLAADHRRRFGVAPTEKELAALVDRWVGDEVLYREALALGLDRGDVVVRRRLVQKMQFVLDAVEPVGEPGDAELRAWLAAHPERYGGGARVSFEQVFAGPSGGEQLRAKLVAGEAAAGLPFIGPRRGERQTEREIAARFGAAFGAALVKAPIGTWSLVRSAYGLHVVRVSARDDGPAQLGDVRTQARQDWLAEHRSAQERAATEKLRARWVME